MSEISESARVSLVIADFANSDASNKINLIGAGVAITGIDQQTGQSAQFSVVVLAHVDPRFRGQEYALELTLYGDDGQPFVPPGPVEQGPVRIARMVTVEPARAPAGAYIPADTVWAGSQMIVNFQGGLPLTAGRGYEWRVAIDQNVVARAGLFVAGAPPLMIG